MARKQSFSDKFWHDKHGNFVVWQKPNIFLWIWIVALVVSIVMSSNSFSRDLSWLGGIAIIIWAVLELVRGVNYFRRLLGLSVLLLIIASHFL
jgi:hypothetical protein